MTDNMNKALADALAHGTGVMHKSDYVAYGDVHLSPRDSQSQHCPNCEAQAAEIEKLREATADAYAQGYRDGHEDHLEGRWHKNNEAEGYQNWLANIAALGETK